MAYFDAYPQLLPCNHPAHVTLISIDRPFHYTGIGADIDRFICLRPMRDRLNGACLGAFSTYFTEFFYAEADRLIIRHGQVGDHFTDPDARAILGCDQEAVPPQFSQPGVNRQGDA